VDFRPAYEALATRLGDDLRDVLRSPVERRDLPAGSFKTKDQPALCVLEQGDDPIPDDGRPVAWQLSTLLVLHSRIGADDAAPGATLLDLRERVENALKWRAGEPRSPDGYWTTLGGAVRQARLGAVRFTNEGDEAAQITTLMDVSMLVTPPAG
jgi:hypothetical protein